MSSSTSTGGRLRVRALRAAVVTTAAGVVAAGGAGAALAAPSAEPAPEVLLAPGDYASFLVSFENVPFLEITDVIGTDEYTTVPVAPEGVVQIAVPDLLTVPEGAAVTLEMREPEVGAEEPEPIGPSFTTADGTLSAEVADGVVEVTLPAAEALQLGTQDTGILEVPVTSDVLDLPEGASSITYFLDLDSERGEAALLVAPVLVIASALDSTPVVAGQPFDLVLPQDSRLAEVGVSGVEPVVVGLRLDGHVEHAPAPAVELVDDRTARVTVPAGAEAGSYDARVVLVPRDADGQPLQQVASVTSLGLEVAAAPAPEPTPTPTEEATAAPTSTRAPIRPATNPGLRSNTGVEEAAAGSSRNALLVGGGLALVAAAGATVLAARRRTGS